MMPRVLVSTPPSSVEVFLGGRQQLPCRSRQSSSSSHVCSATTGIESMLTTMTIHMEPANALSLPTWAVHTSSVMEWALAMRLMWTYGDVSGNPRWKGMTWGMLPCLGSAMCACTWHFFYNAQEVEFLVLLQAMLTVVGNATCWWAAYRIYAMNSDDGGSDDGNSRDGTLSSS